MYLYNENQKDNGESEGKQEQYFNNIKFMENYIAINLQ